MTTATASPPGDDVQPTETAGSERPRPGPLTRLKRSWDRHWYAWAMVLPVVLVLGVLVGSPLGRRLYLSFTDANELNVAKDIGVNHIPATYKFVGLDNYWNILSGKEG